MLPNNASEVLYFELLFVMVLIAITSLSRIIDRVQEVFGVMWMLLSFRTMVHQLKLQKSKCSLSLLISCVAVMNVLAPALRYTFVLFCIDWFSKYISCGLSLACMWTCAAVHNDCIGQNHVLQDCTTGL